MPGKIKISVPTPCHENWQQMTRIDRGRFCSSCQKSVIDFTNASDRDIAAAINTGDTCGRFRVSQLDRDLLIPQKKSHTWIAASVAAIGVLTIGNNPLLAQTPVNTEQAENKTDDINSSITKKNVQ